MIQPDRFREFAPAKLNLYLHVLGRDARGYHLLDSLVAFADVGDELLAAPADGFSLKIVGQFCEGLEADERNLIWKAAANLGAALGYRPDLAVTLVKNLPVASGIGGGSSDAAAMLRLLCRLWQVDIFDPQVTGVAQALGSDVPVCVPARACFMGGFGEILEPCPALPEASLILVNPGVPVPTREVFAARRGDFAARGRFVKAPADASALADMLATRDNGLAEPAIRIAPQIGTALEALRHTTGCLLARMLGSGATCFGLFANDANARAGAARIRDAFPQWWVAPCRLKEIDPQEA